MNSAEREAIRAERPEHAVENTDREIWREREGDYYADSIHVTKDGGIGINCGGNVVVKSVRAWHAAALASPPPSAELAEQLARRHYEACRTTEPNWFGSTYQMRPWEERAQDYRDECIRIMRQVLAATPPNSADLWREARERCAQACEEMATQFARQAIGTHGVEHLTLECMGSGAVHCAGRVRQLEPPAQE